jgi:hypothetical protein
MLEDRQRQRNLCPRDRVWVMNDAQRTCCRAGLLCSPDHPPITPEPTNQKPRRDAWALVFLSLSQLCSLGSPLETLYPLECPQIFSTPEPILRPLPATGHDAEILDVDDPDLGYDVATFPYQQPQQKMRPTCRTGLLGEVWGHMSISSIVRPHVPSEWKGGTPATVVMGTRALAFPLQPARKGEGP